MHKVTWWFVNQRTKVHTLVDLTTGEPKKAQFTSNQVATVKQWEFLFEHMAENLKHMVHFPTTQNLKMTTDTTA